MVCVVFHVCVHVHSCVRAYKRCVLVWVEWLSTSMTCPLVVGVRISWKSWP